MSHLGKRAAGLFAGALMHVPIEIAREARARARQVDADCIVAIGGGSTIGLGKAIALETGLPLVAVPTTYAGSEMTPIYGVTETGIKKSGGRCPRTSQNGDLRCVAHPRITRRPLDDERHNAIAMPPGAESKDLNPLTMLMAQAGIRALIRAFRSSMGMPAT